MLSRYTTKCSYCDRNMIAGKHHIIKSDGVWIHQECFHLKKDGILPTPEEDMGVGSCGVCYSCIRLKGECMDAHTLDVDGGSSPIPHHHYCNCGGDFSRCCDNPQLYQAIEMDEPVEECIGCETGADCDGAHTCGNHHNYLPISNYRVCIESEICIGCETGADCDGAHTCNK